jgi:hypothetical protein
LLNNIIMIVQQKAIETATRHVGLRKEQPCGQTRIQATDKEGKMVGPEGGSGHIGASLD